MLRGIITRNISFTPTGKRVAIVGSSGAVGQELVRCLHRRGTPLSSLKLLGSKRSAGTVLRYTEADDSDTVIFEDTVSLATEDAFGDVDVALFSAGGATSRTLGPAAAKAGAVVIDNSSAFRMHPDVPLIVPEVNPEAVKKHKGIIANPNCSTILMNLAVYPLHAVSPVDKIVVSTYQAASGAGKEAMMELENQAHAWSKGEPLPQDIFGRQYVWNLFSHNSDIDKETLYNEEEMKMVNETRKIFEDESIQIDATCIRVPVLRSHAESIHVTFKPDAAPMTREKALEVLAKAPGVDIDDNVAENQFPEPLKTSGIDNIAVGRVRNSIADPAGKGLSMFICGDQLLKGAALNAVQILELL